MSEPPKESLAEKANAVSTLISSMTVDPAERYAIAAITLEMHREGMRQVFTTIKTSETEPTQEISK